VCYCGLNVSEKQSGKNQSKNCYITKRGNKLLRHTFYMMVLVHLNHRKQGDIAAFFNHLKEKGKHPKQCVTACARKLAIKTYYAMLHCHDPARP
jgi:transposase